MKDNKKIQFFILIGGIILVGFLFIRFGGIFHPAALVLSPNGGETFAIGKQMTVQWMPGSPGIREIHIVAVADGNDTLVYGAIPFGYPVADTSGSYTFTIPSLAPGNYVIKIYKANSNDFDVSDAPIKIVHQEIPKVFPTPPSLLPSIAPPSSNTVTGIPMLTMVSPNGGEQMAFGSPMKITWTSQNAPSYMNVEITLFTSAVHPPQQSVCTAGACTQSSYVWVANVAHQSPNDGNELWVIPSNLVPGSKYYIRIGCSVPVGMPYPGCKIDDSDRPFSIGVSSAAPVPPPVIVPPPPVPIPQPVPVPKPASPKIAPPPPVEKLIPSQDPSIKKEVSSSSESEVRSPPEEKKMIVPPQSEKRGIFREILHRISTAVKALWGSY